MIRIYTLTDPRTNLIFYVGASKSSTSLIVARHLSYYARIRRELRKLGLRPIFTEIEATDNAVEAGRLEEYWIWQFRSWGFQLENERLCSGYPGSSFAYGSKNWMKAMREQGLHSVRTKVY